MIVDIDDFIIEHMNGFIDAFIKKEFIERYKNLLKSKKGVLKWIDQIDHFQPKLSQDFCTQFDRASIDLLELQKHINISSMHSVVVLSSIRCLGLSKGYFSEIMDMVIKTDIGAIVSIIPGELAIYWGEERDCKYILVKNNHRIKIKGKESRATSS